MQTAVYAGAPAANTEFQIAADQIKKIGWVGWVRRRSAKVPSLSPLGPFYALISHLGRVCQGFLSLVPMGSLVANRGRVGYAIKESSD